MICSWSSVGRVESESGVVALVDMLAVGIDKMWSCFLEADENETDERRGIA